MARIAAGCILSLVLLLSSSVAYGGSVFILGDGDTENSIAPILRGRGHSVTIFEGTHEDFDGTTSLAAYDAVVLLDGYTWGYGMPTAGQKSIVNFVHAGGGLVLTEWLSLDFARGEFADLDPVILLQRYQGREAAPTYQITADHPVTAGLPSTFSVPYAGHGEAYARRGTVLAWAPVLNDLAVAGTYGDGRIVHYSIAGNYKSRDPFDKGTQSENLNQFFAQGVEWTGGMAPVPLPPAVWIAAALLVCLGSVHVVRRRRTKTP